MFPRVRSDGDGGARGSAEAEAGNLGAEARGGQRLGQLRRRRERDGPGTRKPAE